MNTFDTFFSGFVLFGTMLALVIAAIIWSKESDHQEANRYLCICLVISSITYTFYGLLYPVETLSYLYPRLFFVPLALELLILPHCYFYVRSLYQLASRQSLKRIGWHYLPFVTACLLLVPIFMSLDQRLGVIEAWFSGSYVEEVHIIVVVQCLI